MADQKTAYVHKGGPAEISDLEVTGISTDKTIKIYEAVITHDTLDAAALTQSISPAGFPANAVPLNAYIELDTAFSGGAVSSLTVKVGDAAVEDELFTATSVFTGAALGIKFAEGVATGKFRHEAAYVPRVTFTAVGANVVALTAGSLVVRIAYFLLPPATA